MARLTPAPNQDKARISPAPTARPTSKKEGRNSRFVEEMADERAPLLSYHETQRERTEQLLAHVEETAKQSNEEGFPVDHGKVAWMQVLGGFVLFANSWYALPFYFYPGKRGEERRGC